MDRRVVHYLSDFESVEKAQAWLDGFGLTKFGQHLTQAWEAMQASEPDEEGKLKDYHLRIKVEPAIPHAGKPARYSSKFTRPEGRDDQGSGLEKPYESY